MSIKTSIDGKEFVGVAGYLMFMLLTPVWIVGLITGKYKFTRLER